mgnify:CR=1 FL=1
MRRKLAVLLVGTMIGSAMLAGCGQNGNTESKQTAAETGELKGDITFLAFLYTGAASGGDTGDRRPVYEG